MSVLQKSHLASDCLFLDGAVSTPDLEPSHTKVRTALQSRLIIYTESRMVIVAPRQNGNPDTIYDQPMNVC